VAGTETIAGFAEVDSKGRFSLAKQLRQSLGVESGSTIAWVKVGDAVLLVPQDKHLAHLMDAAARVIDDGGISVEDMLATLPETRAQVVAEQYGEDFLDELERVGKGQATSADAG